MDDVKMSRKKQNSALLWKKLIEDVDIEEPTSFLNHVYSGCTQRERKPNKKIIGQYNKMFEFPYFCWSNRGITTMGQTLRKNFSVVLRRGRTCSKMRGTALRIGKTKRRSNYSKFLVLVWTITKSERKNRKTS